MAPSSRSSKKVYTLRGRIITSEKSLTRNTFIFHESKFLRQRLICDFTRKLDFLVKEMSTDHFLKQCSTILIFVSQ